MAQTRVNGHSRQEVPLIIDGLSMPTPERRWFEEWRDGGIGCVNTCICVWENAREAITVLSRWRRALEENSDLIAPATSVDEIRSIAASGRTAVVFSFQNTAPIEHDIELFTHFRALGVCIMQLTYNLQNYIGCGYWEAKDAGISSRFGALAVQEMNRVGIMIDLSHCGERTTLDAIEMSEKPVAITHANPREFVGSPVYGAGRLKTTEAIKALSARGGVIGLTPNRNMTPEGAATTLERFSEMVAWTVDRIGIDHVGIGLDYCPGHPNSVRTWWRFARWSRESAPAEQMKIAPHEGWSDWIRSPAQISNIAKGLSQRGFLQGEIDKVMGGNWLRIYDVCFAPAAAYVSADS
ncbi:dipeptidase [Futiania mangrovi]|uniref:Dipeptidase n=1 Tax=Futiania mangrovi TaxID=2959716 RepID=A0A9J6PCS4_9PROT|nr:membrane dipeptidase [Futiania mangrovii]MCP1337149.1 dipeptidase [Futiania mangrovii]